MIEQLKARRYLCSNEHINAFYDHIPRTCNDQCGDCNYSWETDSTGYFLHGKSSVSYFRPADGMVFRLMRWYHSQDIDMLNELYNIAANTNEFRIEKVITSDIVMFEGVEYLYCVFQRPNKEFGLTGVEDALLTDSDLFFREFVDQFATLIPYMDSMSKKYGLGMMLQSVNIMNHRARDSVGYYWKDIRIFKLPTDQVIFESKKRLLAATKIIDKSVTQTIIDYANQKWRLP
jgi:hypothetical protein